MLSEVLGKLHSTDESNSSNTNVRSETHMFSKALADAEAHWGGESLINVANE